MDDAQASLRKAGFFFQPKLNEPAYVSSVGLAPAKETLRVIIEPSSSERLIPDGRSGDTALLKRVQPPCGADRQ